MFRTYFFITVIANWEFRIGGLINAKFNEIKRQTVAVNGIAE